MATRAAKKTVVVMLDRESPTKNKQRFEERDREREEVIGILYVSKKKDKELGEPDSLKVTIEQGD